MAEFFQSVALVIADLLALIGLLSVMSFFRSVSSDASKSSRTLAVRDAFSLAHKGYTHPITCGNNRCDENHRGGGGTLVATVRGWICPFCDYTQNWAHDWMMDNAACWEARGR